jgi:hypothetical protein
VHPSFVGVGCVGGGGLVGGTVGELAGGGLGVAVGPWGGDVPVDVAVGGGTAGAPPRGAVGFAVGAAVF